MSKRESVKQSVVAAIAAAINAYIEEEQAQMAVSAAKPPLLPLSPWRMFGQQEQMRRRTWMQQRLRRPYSG